MSLGPIAGPYRWVISLLVCRQCYSNGVIADLKAVLQQWCYSGSAIMDGSRSDHADYCEGAERVGGDPHAQTVDELFGLTEVERHLAVLLVAEGEAHALAAAELLVAEQGNGQAYHYFYLVRFLSLGFGFEEMDLVEFVSYRRAVEVFLQPIEIDTAPVFGVVRNELAMRTFDGNFGSLEDGIVDVGIIEWDEALYLFLSDVEEVYARGKGNVADLEPAEERADVAEPPLLAAVLYELLPFPALQARLLLQYEIDNEILPSLEGLLEGCLHQSLLGLAAELGCGHLLNYFGKLIILELGFLEPFRLADRLFGLVVIDDSEEVPELHFFVVLCEELVQKGGVGTTYDKKMVEKRWGLVQILEVPTKEEALVRFVSDLQVVSLLQLHLITKLQQSTSSQRTTPAAWQPQIFNNRPHHPAANSPLMNQPKSWGF